MSPETAIDTREGDAKLDDLMRQYLLARQAFNDATADIPRLTTDVRAKLEAQIRGDLTKGRRKRRKKGPLDEGVVTQRIDERLPTALAQDAPLQNAHQQRKNGWSGMELWGKAYTDLRDGPPLTDARVDTQQAE